MLFFKKIIKNSLRSAQDLKSRIHFSANISTDTTLGKNLVILEKSVISKSTLGDQVHVSSNVSINNSSLAESAQVFTGSEITLSKLGRFVKIRSRNTLVNTDIGDFSYTSHNTVIQNAAIGKFCSIGPDVKIGLGIHPTHFISTHPLFYSPQKACAINLRTDSAFTEHKRVEIGNDVWIGANVIVSDGIKIGNGAIIAAGAVVTKNIDDYMIVGGVPAKMIKMRFSQQIISRLLASNWWNADIDILRKNIPYMDKPIVTESDIEAFLNAIK